MLRRTLSYIPANVITIGDAKRGDIGNTAAMYAHALLVDLGFQAATVNPYMGFDSVEPFLRDPERGAFVLGLTSNPGAKDFQYLKVGARPLYERVVRKAASWNANGNCGLVVGATRPAELKRIRAMAPSMPILIPGVGAQGGDLKNAVRNGCDRDGLGLGRAAQPIKRATNAKASAILIVLIAFIVFTLRNAELFIQLVRCANG